MNLRTSFTGLNGDTRAALTDTLPVGAGMIPLGVAFGILVTQAGLAWWWTPVISGLLFAGSLEFLLLSLMTAGAPLATIALTTLLVNSRHVVYCLTFPLHRVRGRLGTALFALRIDRRGLHANHRAGCAAVLQPPHPHHADQVCPRDGVVAEELSDGLLGDLLWAHVPTRRFVTKT